MKTILDFILARLKEKSTWLSLITLVTSLGLIAFNPEQVEAITTAGMSVAVAIATFTKEK